MTSINNFLLLSTLGIVVGKSETTIWTHVFGCFASFQQRVELVTVLEVTHQGFLDTQMHRGVQSFIVLAVVHHPETCRSRNYQNWKSESCNHKNMFVHWGGLKTFWTKRNARQICEAEAQANHKTRGSSVQILSFCCREPSKRNGECTIQKENLSLLCQDESLNLLQKPSHSLPAVMPNLHGFGGWCICAEVPCLGHGRHVCWGTSVCRGSSLSFVLGGTGGHNWRSCWCSNALSTFLKGKRMNNKRSDPHICAPRNRSLVQTDQVDFSVCFNVRLLLFCLGEETQKLRSLCLHSVCRLAPLH